MRPSVVLGTRVHNSGKALDLVHMPSRLGFWSRIELQVHVRNPYVKFNHDGGLEDTKSTRI